LVTGSGSPACSPLEKPLLERGERDVDVAVEDGSEVGGALRVRAPHRLDLGGSRAEPHSGLVAGPSEVIGGEVGGEVDEGLRDGGDRDAAPERADPFRAPRAHALHAPVRPRGYLGRRGWPSHDPEEMRRRLATQDRSVAASAHRGEVSRFDARRPMPDAIDASVLPQQRTDGDAVLDLGRRDPRAQQLRPRDDAVRAGRDPGDLSSSAASWSHYDH
jgi:hypothetical protein